MRFIGSGKTKHSNMISFLFCLLSFSFPSFPLPPLSSHSYFLTFLSFFLPSFSSSFISFSLSHFLHFFSQRGISRVHYLYCFLRRKNPLKSWGFLLSLFDDYFYDKLNRKDWTFNYKIIMKLPHSSYYVPIFAVR